MEIGSLHGLKSLWAKSLGDPRICVAVLDGPVEQTHPCFKGANLTRLPTLVSESSGGGLMSGHGTHVASTIFGQHHSSVHGIAPKCRGLIVPVFSDTQRGKLSQIDLGRAINQAVEQGAHVINISGGELSESGEADPILANAVRFCNDEGVLIVAAAGNNGCQCLHVPAALPSVLAVGAMDAQGLPIDYSNWGQTYEKQGILAPGENILGADPGGGISSKSGTSFATPIVTGIVALLLSIQLARGEKPNPHAIREILLKSALPCNSEIAEDCRRFLAGSLNIPGVYTLIKKGGLSTVSNKKSKKMMIQPSGVDLSEDGLGLEPSEVNLSGDELGLEPSKMDDSGGGDYVLHAPETGVEAAEAELGVEAAEVKTSSIPNNIQNSGNAMSITSDRAVSHTTRSNVIPSGDCGCNGGKVASSVMPSNAPMSIVYALGTIGYDFGTEARRDSFKQLMPMVRSDNGEVPESTLPAGVFPVPANPYDARQMAHYLESDISEAASLIWTLNLELTPIYAIVPQAPFALAVYEQLRDFLAGQVLAEESQHYVERVSIPAVLTGRSVTLFSGQVVPVIEPANIRGMYGWKVNRLLTDVMQAIQGQDPPPNLTATQQEEIDYSLRNFLMRIYYDLRNLGQTSAERAQNFASTNVFQYADALVNVLSNQSRSWAVSGDPKAVTMQLDTFEVERSPFCRKDSDCWDVKIKFFDPENDRRAKRVLRYTIDVSDIMPVTLGKPRIWDVAS